LHYTVSNNQPSVSSHNTSNKIETSITSSPTIINNQDSSSIKTIQRRKKGPGHRRTNSKGSVTSWTPPTLSAIADQEEKRASINITSNMIEETFPVNPPDNMNSMTPIKSPIPSISADIDSKLHTNNRQLNPKTLKLDLRNPLDSPTSQQRPPTLFTYASRKSSSSDPEDFNQSQHQILSRQRRRRNLNPNNTKITSPSSITTTRSIKSNSIDQQTPQIDEIESNNRITDDNEKQQTDPRKHPRSVSFLLSPTTTNDRSPSYQQRKIFTRVNKKKRFI
jgi:hypothetical protein